MNQDALVTSCCGRPIEDCPGCPGVTRLVPYNDEEAMDESVEVKTVADLQRLIDEATPESARDRIRRRSSAQLKSVRSHHDDEGHAKLQPPKFADRIQPKREKSPRTQMQHRGRLGHRHSARAQRGKHKRFEEAIEFIANNIGRPIDDKLLSEVADRQMLHTVALRLLRKPGINRDWLFNLCDELGEAWQMKR